MTYREEFPNFDPALLPALPSDFEDTSWRNDSCPSFWSRERRLIVWVDHRDPEERETPEMKRFCAYGTVEDDPSFADDQPLIESNDWAEVEALIEARATPLMRLSAEFQAWASANGHPEGDAEEALMVEANPVKRAWLADFIERWQAAAAPAPAPEENTDAGEFVTEAELSVLRALWRQRVDIEGAGFHAALAETAGAPVSMIERVEALLFPNGF